MLLESVMAEISFDILHDLQPQMQRHDTTPPPPPPPAAAFHGYNYTDRVLLEMCSPSESSTELHEGKEERQNSSSRRVMMNLSEDEEIYNCYKEAGCVPFKWEVQPGVPKPPQRESDLGHDEDQSSSAPLRLPPSASYPAATSTGTASSAYSKKNAGGCLSWNRSHFSTKSIIVCKGSVQGGNINGYDGDDDEDSNEKWSPVSTLELPESPRSSSVIAQANSPARLSPSFDDSHDKVPSASARSACTTLLWGVFPCKCIFLPWLKPKGKKKQPEWATGQQGR